LLLYQKQEINNQCCNHPFNPRSRCSTFNQKLFCVSHRSGSILKNQKKNEFPESKRNENELKTIKVSQTETGTNHFSQMKIIIVGATGTIGQKVTANLEQDHEIIKVGSKSGDMQADITKPKTLENLFEEVGSFDALVSTTGAGHFGPLNEMTAEDFKVGLHSKLLGQVNLVLTGQHYINPKGSFTLVSGILSDDPVAHSVNVSAVNAAINGFVNAAAQELENDVRINVVSPGVVEDSPELFDAFPGHIPVSMDRVVKGFRKSVLGIANGEIIKVW